MQIMNSIKAIELNVICYNLYFSLFNTTELTESMNFKTRLETLPCKRRGNGENVI